MEKIRVGCHHLEDLTIDLFPFSNAKEPTEALKVLTKFEKLKRLCIVADVRAGTGAIEGDSYYDEAKEIMLQLHASKKGIPFEPLQIWVQEWQLLHNGQEGMGFGGRENSAHGSSLMAPFMNGRRKNGIVKCSFVRNMQ